MPHDRMLASRNTHTWIQKYIFPGGLLPSTEAIFGITERQTRLRTVDMFSLRPHYADTLRLWRERFIARRDAVAELGFDEVFHRMWELYLAYSEAGFPVRVSRRLPVDFRTAGRRSMNFVVVSAASLAILVVVHATTFLIGRRIGRYNVVDAAWGVGFVAVAAVAAAVGTGDLFRRMPAARSRRGVGAATGLAHDRQVRGQGRRPALSGPAARRLLGRSCDPQGLPHPGSRDVVRLAAAATFGRPRPDPGDRCARCWSSASRYGPSAWSSRPSAIISCAGSRPTPPTRASSWTADCGRGPGTPTTSATRACGGGCGWRASQAGCRAHSAVAGRHDLLPGVRDRCPTHREIHGGTGPGSVNTVPALHFSYRDRPDRDYRDDIDSGG